MSPGRRKEVRLLAALITVVSVATVLLLVFFVVLPGMETHFGFPSQQQATGALGHNVTRSSTFTQSNFLSIQNIGKIETVWYNSSSGITASVSEIQIDTPHNATLLYENLVLYATASALSVNLSNFGYDAANVSILTIHTIDSVLGYVILFHRGSFVCNTLIIDSLPNQLTHIRQFAEAVVNSMA